MLFEAIVNSFYVGIVAIKPTLLSFWFLSVSTGRCFSFWKWQYYPRPNIGRVSLDVGFGCRCSRSSSIIGFAKYIPPLSPRSGKVIVGNFLQNTFVFTFVVSPRFIHDTSMRHCVYLFQIIHCYSFYNFYLYIITCVRAIMFISSNSNILKHNT